MEAAAAKPDFADIFERVLVPAIFGPYARDLVERVRPYRPSDRILDLGCGTGIVARTLRDRLGGGARVSGVDVNAQMIAKARSIAPAIEWFEGNATALPFADRSFDVVLAQQVLQFVPDRTAALREIKRVLAPGGRVVISTWRPRGHQPLHDAVGRAAEAILGSCNDKRWSLDGDELVALLAAEGFADIARDTQSLTEELAVWPALPSIMAQGFDLAKLTDAERETKLGEAVRAVEGALAPFATAHGFAAASVTNIVTAKVHS
jgi:ubiquinone/menaquinone biosynthesis C-methylase UbiE